MSGTCPLGHPSATSDYCDECGTPMDAVAPARAETTNRTDRTDFLGPRTGDERCDVCGTPRHLRDRFCETCGDDHTSDPIAAVPSAWHAEIAADPARFERAAPDGLVFPGDRPTVTVTLAPGETTLGRQPPSAAPGGSIVLTGAIGDPGVSRHHATIVVEPTGTVWLVDAGSTNGTTVDDDSPLAPGVPVQLADGSRFHLGVWTTITVRTTASSADCEPP
ncbi:MAG: FHA domain-containing protein [Ilumatobacteraceae bacterium]